MRALELIGGDEVSMAMQSKCSKSELFDQASHLDVKVSESRIRGGRTRTWGLAMNSRISSRDREPCVLRVPTLDFLNTAMWKMESNHYCIGWKNMDWEGLWTESSGTSSGLDFLPEALLQDTTFGSSGCGDL